MGRGDRQAGAELMIRKSLREVTTYQRIEGFPARLQRDRVTMYAIPHDGSYATPYLSVQLP